MVTKLKDTHTNDTLTSNGVSVQLAKIEFPKPDISVAVRGAARKVSKWCGIRGVP